ncbi:hypothetical protein EYV94_28025 [Puteibacter caeruleilacunae]|nr:hypothetical protein EYV94_28025 [Puteibacter caeruleilacunae]
MKIHSLSKLIFVGVFLIITSCFEQDDEGDLIRACFNQPNNNCDLYIQSYEIGKAAIPILIELIDVKQKSFVGFSNPYSSTLEGFLLNNYKGIIAAYTIELILAKDTLNNIDVEYNGTTQVNPLNIYGYGVIVRSDKKDIVKEPLTYDEIKEVKKLYFEWWKNSKAKSLLQLRDEWKQKGSVLKNSSFKWI